MTLGMINRGLITTIMTIAEITTKAESKKNNILSGRSSSIALISLENLFKIMPEVLTLKNLVEALMIRLNRFLCSVIEDLIHILLNDHERSITTITVITIKAE